MTKKWISSRIFGMAKFCIVFFILLVTAVSVALLLRGRNGRGDTFAKASGLLKEGMTKAEVMEIVPRPPDNTNAEIVWYWLADPYCSDELIHHFPSRKWQDLEYQPGLFLIFGKDGRLAVNSIQKSAEGTVRTSVIHCFKAYKNTAYVDGLLEGTRGEATKVK